MLCQQGRPRPQASGPPSGQHQRRQFGGRLGGAARRLPVRRPTAAAQSEPEARRDDVQAEGQVTNANGATAAAPQPPAANGATAAAPQPPAAAGPTAAAPQTPAPEASPASDFQRRKMSLQAFLDFDNGPPRVMSLLDPLEMPSPANDAGRGSPARASLPLLLYLPGIDGSGMAAARQFPSLLVSAWHSWAALPT